MQYASVPGQQLGLRRNVLLKFQQNNNKQKAWRNPGFLHFIKIYAHKQIPLKRTLFKSPAINVTVPRSFNIFRHIGPYKPIALFRRWHAPRNNVKRIQTLTFMLITDVTAEDDTVKNLNLLTKATLAVLCVAALSACGKKSSSSTATNAGYTVCPATGINPYTGTQCIPNQQIPVGNGANSCVNGVNMYGQPCQAYGNQIGQQQSCQQVSMNVYYQTGVYYNYYPQFINGQWYCVLAN